MCIRDRPYGPVYGWEPPANMDFDPPTSDAVTLTTWQITATFPVTWSGQDDAFGIMSYDVQYAYSSSLPLTWTGWLTWTTATSATFGPGAEGTTYCFRSRARDWGYALEDWPADPGDTCTTPDLTAPSSQVAALPAYSLATFTVTWSGSDALSGVQDYDVQVCAGDCPGGWSGWLTHTTATTHTFTGTHGVTYAFRSGARDHAGNVESWTTTAAVSTTVDAQPPATAVDTLPPYTTTTTFPVSWQGSDDLSGIDHYDLYYATESAADWSLWLAGLTTTQAFFTGTCGQTYHFCSAGTDRAGNTEHCLPTCIGGPPCWPIQSDAHTGVTPWSRVDDLPAETSGNTIHVTWSGAPGEKVVYDVQVRDGLYGMWMPWRSGVTYTSASYTGQYGHIYYFRSRQQAGGIWEVYPYDYDTYTKLVAPAEGEGAAGGEGALVLLFPDEAPDRIEDVTRTQALGTPVVGYIAPAGDGDWYRFELTETMRLRIQLADLPADFDLYIFDGSGQFLWASTWGRQLPEEVVVRVPAGVYYVRLVGYAGAWSGEVPYNLLVERVTH